MKAAIKTFWNTKGSKFLRKLLEEGLLQNNKQTKTGEDMKQELKLKLKKKVIGFSRF